MKPLRLTIDPLIIEEAYTVAYERFEYTKDRKGTGVRTYGERWDQIAQGEVGFIVFSRYLESLRFIVKPNLSVDLYRTSRGIVGTDQEIDAYVGRDESKMIPMSFKVSTLPVNKITGQEWSVEKVYRDCDFKLFVKEHDLTQDFRAAFQVQAYFPHATRAWGKVSSLRWDKISLWLMEHRKEGAALPSEGLRFVLQGIDAYNRYSWMDYYGMTSLERIQTVFKTDPPADKGYWLDIKSDRDQGDENKKLCWNLKIGHVSYSIEETAQAIDSLLRTPLAKSVGIL